MSEVYCLAEPRARRREVAGGKGSALAALVAAGVAVPPGFVVGVGDPAARGWRRDAEAAYDELCACLGDGAELPVAVRSSSPYDDATERSAASLLPTRLGVHDGSAVLAAIEELRDPASWAHLGRYVGTPGVGTPGVGAAPAVVVQALVRAQVSGIAFTAHPVTGDAARVLIEVGRGLGDVVTDGLSVPTLLEVDRAAGFVAAERPGRQEIVHAYDDATGVVREVAVAVAAPTLTDEQAQAVWRAALRAEALFGVPVDVEWALDETDRVGTPEAPGVPALWILQARPITTLPGG